MYIKQQVRDIEVSDTGPSYTKTALDGSKNGIGQNTITIPRNTEPNFVGTNDIFVTKFVVINVAVTDDGPPYTKSALDGSKNAINHNNNTNNPRLTSQVFVQSSSPIAVSKKGLRGSKFIFYLLTYKKFARFISK